MTAGGATTSFRYAGAQLGGEFNLTPTAWNSRQLRIYLYAGGGETPLLWLEGGVQLSTTLTQTPTWFHADRLGSVAATTNSSGAVTAYAYGPYGEPQTWAGSRFRYTGQLALPEAQLYHYRARAYDPMLGRFLQTDPVGYKDDLNLYAYVKDDPIDHTDPTGKWLWPWEKPITVVGGTPAGNKAVQTAVDRGAKTPRGQSLVKQIIGGIFHGNPITVHVTDNHTARSEAPGSNVEVDPSFHPKINTTAGVQVAPTDRIVWHEIGHAVTGTEDSGPGRMDNVRQNENPIAQSLGEPARTTYSTPPQ